MLHLAESIEPVSNDGQRMIEMTAPYVVEVTIEGTCPLLLHRWSCEAVAEKAKAKKGSAAKKSDDVESYVYRCEDGTIGLPGSYLVGSLTDPRNGAAKYLQDPRSPRKSALDLYKAGVVSLTDVATLGKSEWDYLDQRRVMVQRAGITRSRPAFRAGWRAKFHLQVLTPEYVPQAELLGVLTQAGRLVGIGDYRPTFGRFQVVNFSVLAS